MADVTITDAGLRETIAQRLGAVHVEVTDMSGRTHLSAGFRALSMLTCGARRG